MKLSTVGSNGEITKIANCGEIGEGTLDPSTERDEDRLLPPAKVADLFGVDPRTLREWAAAGKISSRRTLGGHRRYRESEVRALLADLAEFEAVA